MRDASPPCDPRCAALPRAERLAPRYAAPSVSATRCTTPVVWTSGCTRMSRTVRGPRVATPRCVAPGPFATPRAAPSLATPRCAASSVSPPLSVAPGVATPRCAAPSVVVPALRRTGRRYAEPRRASRPWASLGRAAPHQSSPHTAAPECRAELGGYAPLRRAARRCFVATPNYATPSSAPPPGRMPPRRATVPGVSSQSCPAPSVCAAPDVRVDRPFPYPALNDALFAAAGAGAELHLECAPSRPTLRGRGTPRAGPRPVRRARGRT